MVENAHEIAGGAAMMTGTRFTSELLGVAWPHHYNMPLAQAVHANMQVVGMPQWSAGDIALAKALQAELGVEQMGLRTVLPPITPPLMGPTAGGSDDIGDVTWTVPTIRLRYPSNIPGAIGHHWSSAVSMATPIAYKGVTAAAKVAAMTVIDVLLRPQLREEIAAYFTDVQTGIVKYEPIQGPDKRPAIGLNARMQAQYRPQLERLYYDPARFDTYLAQLGIAYPES
jgi:aminobenzoyl-glutamate utilization protein B